MKTHRTFFCFFPILLSFLAEPMLEDLAALTDFFFVRPFTLLPIASLFIHNRGLARVFSVDLV